MTNEPWPAEIRLKQGGRMLAVAFEGGEAFDLSAEYLRVMSPSAEVQGHSAAERKTVGGKRNVAIIEIEPMGNYAVRLTFDDMHRTGIFTWRYLHELGIGRETKWAGYLTQLEAKGLTRDKAGVA
ncbi:MAG: DUF971 domain-containing protein [Beijerinckiaceae bacterium]